MIAYLRPILRKLSPFFETRLNSGPETLCTVFASRIPLEGDLKLFYKHLMNKWIKSSFFMMAHEKVGRDCDNRRALVAAAKSIPIKELDFITPELLHLSEIFLDSFIKSDRAASVLPYWLAFHFTGSTVLKGKLSKFFCRPSALPYVEVILKLCPSSAYIPFIHRFMMRFAQHLIPQ